MAAGAEGWQGLQERMSEAGRAGPAPHPPRLGRDSRGTEEVAPSHRDTMGLGQGVAGDGSRHRGGAWREQWGLC